MKLFVYNSKMFAQCIMFVLGIASFFEDWLAKSDMEEEFGAAWDYLWCSTHWDFSIWKFSENTTSYDCHWYFE